MPRRPHCRSRRTAPRPARARLASAGLLAALVLGTACHSFRPAPTPLPPGDPRLRIRFGEPRDLRAVGGAGDTLAWPRMSVVVSRLRGVRGDTLHLRVESMQREDEGSQRWDRSAPTVAVLPAAGDRVEMSQLDRRKTALQVIGTAASLVLAGLLVFLIAYATSGEGNT